jgi:alpha-glucosidase
VKPAVHHDGSALYVSDPVPALGDTVTLWLRVPVAAGVERVAVRSTPDAEPRFGVAEVDRRDAGEVWWRSTVEVRNPLTNYRFLLDGPAGYRWYNARGLCTHDVTDANDFRLLTYDPPPAWARDAIVYQIFPDRFARSPAAAGRQLPDWAIPCDWDTPVIGRGPETPHQFYGGDLDGITGHLAHIEALGANTVYLTPIFPARSNHRYNASAFDRVDPLLGGDEALHRLGDAVHAKGMRLLGDLTTNHCGDDHPWFAEPELFYVDDNGDYESWLGHKSLPKFNWGSTELRRRFFDGPDAVVAAWLSTLDGWRVDVANMTGRRAADDYTLEVARLMRQAVTKARPDALLVAEHAHDPTADLDADGWQGTMNYAGFTRPLWSWLRGEALDVQDFLGVPAGIPRRAGTDVVATMTEFAARMSWRTLTHSWNLLGSHDTPRIHTVTGSTGRSHLATGMLATMPGTPMLFAGDEFGLGGVNGEDSRKPTPWGAPVLPWYRELFALRSAQPALREGGFRWVHVDGDTLAFERETAGSRLLVLARRAPGEALPVPPDAHNRYGGADTDDGDGPTFQVWEVPPRAS